MTRTVKSLLSATLALGLSGPLSAFAQNEPRPAPSPESGQDQPVKPGQIGKPVKPTQGPDQGQAQVAIGVIQKVDPDQRTIVIQQNQGSPYQYQTRVKPGQGQKADADGVLIVVVSDQTVIQPLEAKGTPPAPEQGRKVKPTKPTQGPEQVQQTQGGKVKPTKPTQGPEQVETGQGAESAQQQLSGLQVGQLVRVVYQQQGGKPQATQVRVLQGQQTEPTPMPSPAPEDRPQP